MKKILLFTSILSFSTAMNAQTINSTNIVDYGDTIFSATDNSASISLGTAGTGNTWNFSGLLTNSIDTIAFYHPFHVAGNAATTAFPYSTHAIKEDTNYVFLQRDANSLQLLGLSTGTIHVPSQDPETVITFPSTYGTAYLDTARTTTTVSGAAVGQPLADSVKVISITFVESDFDASGTLTTPYGIFSSIRQNLRRQTKTDTYAKGALTGGTYTLITSELDTAYSHQYWSDAATAKFALVTYDIDASGALTGDVSWIRGMTELNNTGEKELERKSISIFPNPVQNTLTIDNQDAINAITIMDITGKVVFRSENRNDKTLNVDFLNKGIYIMSIETDTYLGTSKFIKQ